MIRIKYEPNPQKIIEVEVTPPKEEKSYHLHEEIHERWTKKNKEKGAKE
jgi:hypothetical protein